MVQTIFVRVPLAGTFVKRRIPTLRRHGIVSNGLLARGARASNTMMKKDIDGSKMCDDETKMRCVFFA
jgi:hypothetical protein